MFDNPFFKKFPQQWTSFVDDEGEEKRYLFPTFYEGSRGAMGFFTCSWAKARQALPSSRLAPPALGNRALVVFAAFEYLNPKGLEPYREVFFGIPALHFRKGRLLPRAGMFMCRLIVDVPENVQRGKHLWGMDKKLGEFSFFDEGNSRVCEVYREGRLALRFEAPMVGRSRKFESCNRVFTVKDGLLLTSRSCMAGRKIENRGKGRLALGPDPFAVEMDALEISRTPLLVRYFPCVDIAMHLPSESEPV